MTDSILERAKRAAAQYETHRQEGNVLNALNAESPGDTPLIALNAFNTSPVRERRDVSKPRGVTKRLSLGQPAGGDALNAKNAETAAAPMSRGAALAILRERHRRWTATKVGARFARAPFSNSAAAPGWVYLPPPEDAVFTWDELAARDGA